MSEITINLADAFDRIEDFLAVQAASNREELLDAVIRLQASVVIDDEDRALIGTRLDSIPGSSRAPGHVLLGLIVGLMAAQLQADELSV